MEAARPRLWVAVYGHMLLRPQLRLKNQGCQKNSGVFAELKTMVVIGYGGLVGKVEGIKMLVLQILLAQQNT